MRQVLFKIPGVNISIFGYGVMLFFAFLLSMNLAAWRARREKLDPELIYDMSLWVLIGGLVGARLFYVWQYWGIRIHRVWEIFQVWNGGIVFYGSIMGGVLAFFVYRWLRPFPLRPVLDVLAPALALGIAIGRLGCFLNGCCYGDQCDLPWAVRFPGPRSGVAGSLPWLDQVHRGQIPETAEWSLPVHPTQIYSTVDGLVLLGLLSAYFPLRRRDGEVMALLMVTYPISRFLIEALRNDEGVFFAGMTISQNVSVLLLVCGLAFWAYLSRQPRTRYADETHDPSSRSELAAVAAT
jgi:phosphatidylglycerol:prolipoprotein diacylglycerol transferase